MKPLKDFDTLKRGYRFNEKTSYTAKHRGLDLICPIGTKVFAPIDGTITTSYGSQGGKWMTLTGSATIKFCHLNKYLKTGKVKEGDIIAETGNTGSLSTGPHVHIEVILSNIYTDPEVYFMNQSKTLPPSRITFIGTYNALQDELVSKLEYYGFPKNFFTTTQILTDIKKDVGMLLQEEAEAIIEANNIQDKFIFVCYNGNPTATYNATSYYPKRNSCYSTIPLPTTIEVLIHEFLHQLRKYINSNHLGYVEDIEFLPPNWRFEEQIKQILPYLNTMSEKVVKQLQALEGYSDPAGVLYWTGKSVEEYLKARLADKIKTLEETL
jgi:hypothetical protein